MPRPRAPTRRPRPVSVVRGQGAYRVRSTVPKNKVRGRGFYKGFGQHIGSTIGGMAGGAMNPALAASGAKIGQWIGGRAAEATGWGAYTVKHNSLVAAIPTIVNARVQEGAVVIRHKEYLCDVVSGSNASGSAFNVVSFPLNPGMSSTFPWLSGVAQNFQEYKINGAIVEYRPTSGNAVSSSNAALGEVILATQYNSLNAAFTNKQQMLNEEFSVSTVPSMSVAHPIECANSQTPVDKLYIRSAAPGSNADLRLYDLGNLSVATQGQQSANATLGEIWITYEVLLYKPSLQGH